MFKINFLKFKLVEKTTTISPNPVFFLKILTTCFRHISAYYQVMSNCERVSLLQFYKFILKCWQWCLKGNKLMRLTKLPWNEPEIFRILYQIGTRVQNWRAMYGLCKVHKQEVDGWPPFRPILLALQTPLITLLSF